MADVRLRSKIGWGVLGALLSFAITAGIYKNKIDSLGGNTEKDHGQIMENTRTLYAHDKRLALLEQSAAALPQINSTLAEMQKSLNSLSLVVARELPRRRYSADN